jgi:hypothetical protein
MPRQTLLEMVQDILNDLESDEVNSINDTVEALQIASIIRNTFYEVINSRLWPTTASIIQLTSLSSSLKPTHMRMIDDISSIEWIKYDTKELNTDAARYQTISYQEPTQFLDTILQRDSNDATVQTVVESTGISLLIKNDAAPTHWTTFDDEYIVFDSFNSAIDSTLQSSKSMAAVTIEPTFLMTDSFVPDLPAKAFPYLLAEAKSSCFEKIKQAPSAKEEQKSRRQRIFLSQEKWRKNRGVKYANFGRK